MTIKKNLLNILPHQKELNDIIFDELGLTEEERKEVYYATAGLVQQRLQMKRVYEYSIVN